MVPGRSPDDLNLNVTRSSGDSYIPETWRWALKPVRSVLGKKKKNKKPGPWVCHLLLGDVEHHHPPSLSFSALTCTRSGPCTGPARTGVLKLSELKRRLWPAGGGVAPSSRCLAWRRGHCHHLRPFFSVVTAPASSVVSLVHGFSHLGPATV